MPAPPAEPTKEVLEKLPQLPDEDPTGKVLLVTMPEAEPAYDTVRMAYTARAYELGYFGDYEWAEKPAAMVHSLLLSTFRRTRFFRQTLSPPDFSAYDFVLNSRLLALTQDYTVKPPELHAALRIQLVDTDRSRVVAAGDFTAKVPITGEGTYGGVVAANEAVAEIMHDVATFVLRSVQRRSRS